MDKALTIRAAQRAGFPTPRTWFPESLEDVKRISAESQPRWIVKPRFTAYGANMVLVDRPSELMAAYVRASAAQSRSIVQEYIHAESRQEYYLTVDQTGRFLSLVSPNITRVYIERVSEYRARWLSRGRAGLVCKSSERLSGNLACGEGIRYRRSSIHATAFQNCWRSTPVSVNIFGGGPRWAWTSP